MPYEISHNDLEFVEETLVPQLKAIRALVMPHASGGGSQPCGLTVTEAGAISMMATSVADHLTTIVHDCCAADAPHKTDNPKAGEYTRPAPGARVEFFVTQGERYDPSSSRYGTVVEVCEHAVVCRDDETGDLIPVLLGADIKCLVGEEETAGVSIEVGGRHAG